MYNKLNALTCKVCDGEGIVADYNTDPDGFLNQVCPKCGGEGWIDEEEEQCIS